MDASVIIISLCVLIALAGVLVWLFSRVQEHHRAHYSALITVAAKHELSFSDDPDPSVRLRLDGNIDGVKLRILSRVSSGKNSPGPSTEISALFSTGLPKDTSIVRNETTGELRANGTEDTATTKHLRDRRLRQSLAAIAELKWGAPNTDIMIDDKGIRILVSTLADNSDVIAQSLTRVLAVKQTLNSV